MIGKNIVNAINARFKEIKNFYKKIEILISTKEITFYRVINGNKEQLGEEDSRWIEFCRELFEEECMPDRIFKELIERDYTIEEISFIWYEDKVSEEQIEEFSKKSSTILCPRKDKKEFAIILDNKECRKVEVYIF